MKVQSGEEPISIKFEDRKPLKCRWLRIAVFVYDCYVLWAILLVWDVLVMFEEVDPGVFGAIIKFLMIVILWAILPGLQYAYLFKKSYKKVFKTILKWSPLWATVVMYYICKLFEDYIFGFTNLKTL